MKTLLRRLLLLLPTSLALFTTGPWSSLSAAVIDAAAVGNPLAVTLADQAAMTRWRALFDPEPAWISRQAAFLSMRVPDFAPTLFAARLLYAGEPWTRRDAGAASTSDRRWAATDRDTRAAVLREMRWMHEPALAPVLAQFIGSSKEPDLLRQALVGLWQLDPVSVPALALRLADPRQSDRLPGAAVAGCRQMALLLLIDLGGFDDARTRSAMSWAFLQTSGGERTRALSLLPRGAAPDLLKPALLRLNWERREKVLDEEGHAALVIACTRLGATLDRDTATALMDITVAGDSDIAAAAASALAANLGWSENVDLVPLLTRISSTAPGSWERHALMNVLMRLRPDAVAGVIAPDSPWADLAKHRARLDRWSWQEYVK